MRVPYIRQYAAAVQAKSWEEVAPKKKEKIASAVTRLAASVRRDGNPKPGIRSRFLFRMFSGMHAAGWDSSPVEKQYWIENGWIRK